jgi:F-type H+-transporting ATPase subunit epsilon
MAAQFELSILTPERTVYRGRVEYVQVPGSEGYLGVLADHAPLVTSLGAGRLAAREPGGNELTWQVSGGFFEVADNHATVLADEVSGGAAVPQGGSAAIGTGD